ncbi:putative oxidation resistance protein 1-like isoform X1 [Capsicum annuum]|nr:putative oxidation resistance protein 1-like isoform X1 [Capsicum annuum]
MAEILFNLAAEILKSLGSLATEEVASIYGLRDEVTNLSATIQAVLIDAEEQQGSSNLISHRLKSIRRDLELIVNDKASLNLVERRQQPLLQEPYSVQLNLDRETYSFVPEGEVIGRSDDKKKIMDFLLDSKFEENVVVISIVGLGGLGKATLAQCVYNDEMIKKNFDKALWVYVSDVFEVKMIAEKIVESGGGKKDNYLQLDIVQNNLRKMLDGKKAKGSKILLTTRSDEVAEVSGSVHQHKLGDLSKEEALILFEKMAFGCNKESENSNLVEIGKEIVRKYGGVPLAIRFDLITMWIAQGFIQATTSNTDNVEDVANSYFADLLRRSFFQETEEHELFMQFYKMHDLIHDLAKEVADRDFFSITKTEDTEVVPERTLYSSCLFKIDGSSTFPNSFYRKHMKLRAFIFLNQSSINVLSNSTLERMISSFSRLRLLHLGHLKIEFLPQSLGGLKHLRYLCISTWSIATLPNSITKLHNLQVLKCHSLTHIPRGLWQLKSLIHLDLDGCSSLEDMPPGIGQLTSLRTLTSVIMGKESCISGEASDMLNELKGLVDLRNILSIKFMGRVHAIGERTPTGVV